MIVTTSFPGDDFTLLKNIQHDSYWQYLHLLYRIPRERYLSSVKFVGIETELRTILQEKQNFDHRVL